MDALRVAVQQPQFLPWDGYWHRVAESDLFVFYGGVQYNERDYGNRVKVAGSWMTVPVMVPHRATYAEVIVEPHEVHKLVRRIEQTYMTKKKPFGYRLEKLCELLESWESYSLLDLLVETHLELQQFLQHQPITRIDQTRWQGTPQEKMGACLDYYLGPKEAAEGRTISMLSSEKVRGWYDHLVDEVWYQQTPAETRDETFMARIVTEEVPGHWPKWSWSR